jgi:hypothetical protein
MLGSTDTVLLRFYLPGELLNPANSFAGVVALTLTNGNSSSSAVPIMVVAPAESAALQKIFCAMCEDLLDAPAHQQTSYCCSSSGSGSSSDSPRKRGALDKCLRKVHDELVSSGMAGSRLCKWIKQNIDGSGSRRGTSEECYSRSNASSLTGAEDQAFGEAFNGAWAGQYIQLCREMHYLMLCVPGDMLEEVESRVFTSTLEKVRAGQTKCLSACDAKDL